MSTTDWIGLVAAVVSVVSGIFTIIFARRAEAASDRAFKSGERANDASERANHIAIGEAERSLRSAIDSARQRMDDITFRYVELKNDEQALDLLRLACRSSVEALLNAYEIACGQFLDGKVDRERFKKTYHSEIRNLCDPKHSAYKELMHPSDTSHLKAIWKVYHQWHSLE